MTSETKAQEHTAEDALVTFAKEIIAACWEGSSVDGGIIQDLAAELGLIERVPYDPEKHGANRIEDFEPGDPIYQYSAALEAGVVAKMREGLSEWIEEHKREAPYHPPMLKTLLSFTEALAPIQDFLWCCHVLGPDDVHPAPDRATAEKWAAMINDDPRFKPKTENDPNIRAVVTLWPWEPEVHAQALPQAIAEWTPPNPTRAEPEA